MKPIRALNSASSLDRRASCPGSAAMEFGRPEEENEFSLEGSLLHHKDEHPEESRDELSDSQRFVLDKNSKLREKFVTAQMDMRGIKFTADRKEFRECEFFLCDEAGHVVEPSIPGHPDFVAVFPSHKVAIITDSKFGRLKVSDADLNLQLRCYAVMVAEHFDLDEILVAITQPWMKSGLDFHSAQYMAADIPAFKAELLSIVRAAALPNAPRLPSLNACRYCKGKTQAACPDALAVMMDFSQFKIEEATPEEFEKYYPVVEYTGGLVESYKRKMKVLAKEGKLTKYELGKPAIDTSVKNFAEAVDLLKDKISRDMIYEHSKFSLDQLSKASAKSMGLSQKDARVEIERILSEKDLLIKKPKEAPLQEKE